MLKNMRFIFILLLGLVFILLLCYESADTLNLNGEKEYYLKKYSDTEYIKKERQIYNVKGEAVSFYSCDFNIEDFMEDYGAKIIHRETVENGTSYYVFSDCIKQSTNLFGTRVNMQIYKRGDYIKIGFPIIYGGY